MSEQVEPAALDTLALFCNQLFEDETTVLTAVRENWTNLRECVAARDLVRLDELIAEQQRLAGQSEGLHHRRNQLRLHMAARMNLPREEATVSALCRRLPQALAVQLDKRRTALHKLVGEIAALRRSTAELVSRTLAFQTEMLSVLCGQQLIGAHEGYDAQGQQTSTDGGPLLEIRS